MLTGDVGRVLTTNLSNSLTKVDIDASSMNETLPPTIGQYTILTDISERISMPLLPPNQVS